MIQNLTEWFIFKLADSMMRIQARRLQPHNGRMHLPLPGFLQDERNNYRALGRSFGHLVKFDSHGIVATHLDIYKPVDPSEFRKTFSLISKKIIEPTTSAATI